MTIGVMSPETAVVGVGFETATGSRTGTGSGLEITTGSGIDSTTTGATALLIPSALHTLHPEYHRGDYFHHRHTQQVYSEEYAIRGL